MKYNLIIVFMFFSSVFGQQPGSHTLNMRVRLPNSFDVEVVQSKLTQGGFSSPKQSNLNIIASIKWLSDSENKKITMQVQKGAENEENKNDQSIDDFNYPYNIARDLKIDILNKTRNSIYNLLLSNDIKIIKNQTIVFT